MKERIKSKLGLLAGEKGQSIIILALAVVVLLAFVGIAIDVGLLYGRRIQLSRAVDAAALAGALELPYDGPYQERAEQFVRTNGFDPVEANVIATPGGGGGVGESHYLTVTAQLPMETMFLRFVGWKTLHVPALAVAELGSPPVDSYASQNASGVAGVVNLNVFGKEGNTIYGDAFSPLYSSELPDETCSCSTPCDNTTQGDQWRGQMYNMKDELGKYPFRIHVPADYVDLNGGREIQVEILDPDDCNRQNAEFRGSCSGNAVEVTLLGGAGTSCVEPENDDRRVTAMADTPDAQNPKWFVRMDQNISFCYGGEDYDDDYGVETQYTLYYENLDGEFPTIAQYTIKDTDCNEGTDLEWVIPPGFSFNLNDYLDATDENGNWSFYLDVEGISGTGGNGYDLWAGPPPTDPNLETYTNVNERNVYLLNEINEGNDPHSSGGVVVWAMGYLPLNVNTANTPFTITLGYIPPVAAGITVTVSNFDLDRDTDLIGPGPTGCNCHLSGHHCFGEYLGYFLEGHAWEGLGVEELIPGDVSCSSNFGEDVLQIPHEFYGGYLYAVFETKTNDTTDWVLEYEGVMDNTYVRLIQ
jgi:hypothetical protein